MTANLTANGSSSVLAWGGGALYVQTQGDFGGGSLAVELDLGSGYKAEYHMTDAESRIFDFPAGNVRFTLSGATSPDIDIEAA